MVTGSDKRKNGRLAIIAGRGRLPLDVAAAARSVGDDPFIIGLKGEAGAIPAAYEHASVGIGDVSSVHQLIKRKAIDRVILSGGVTRRPDLFDLRAPFHLIPVVPGIVRLLRRGGDDALLRAVIAIIERAGCRVVAAQEIVPDLLAETGPLTSRQPSPADWDDIHAACQGAEILGRLDIGQGAVSVGGRVVALEGPEGTDNMIKRVADLRACGRISRSRPGVLVKLCKPQQDERADLPTIGPETIENAQAAGLSGVAVEAGRAFVLDREKTIAEAEAAGLFVVGIERDPTDPERGEGL